MMHLQVANEVIAYQGKSFHSALTTIVSKVRDGGIGNDKAGLNFVISVDQAIAEFTGIKCTTSIVPNSNICVMSSPILARGNVLAKNNEEIYKKYDARRQNVSKGKLEGLIDYDRGLVSGDFSKLDHELLIGTDRLFNKKFSNEEIAAKILHEAGHGYGYLAYAAIFTVRAAHLQACQDALLKENDASKYTLIIDRTRERLGLPASQVLKKEIGTVDRIFTLAASEISEDLLKKDPRGIYTYDTAEELADVFASRHGAGPYLSALRLHDEHLTDPAFFERHRARLFVLLMVSLSTVVATPLSVVFFSIASATMSIDTLFEVLGPERTNSAQMIANIRNTMIQALKEQNLKNKELLADIDVVTKNLEASLEKVNKDYYREIVRFFIPGRSHAVRSREYTDRLASLANNDLFVLAAKLKSR